MQFNGYVYLKLIVSNREVRDDAYERTDVDSYVDEACFITETWLSSIIGEWPWYFAPGSVEYIMFRQHKYDLTTNVDPNCLPEEDHIYDSLWNPKIYILSLLLFLV